MKQFWTKLFEEEAQEPLPWWRKIYDWISLFVSPDQLGYFAAIAVASVVRALGVTVKSGETALLFSFGRAGAELQPGFRILIPFLQVIRRMPSRSRTLDLPSQRVATLEGLVYHVEANLVYRVVDIRKAIIEIDSLEKGMLQILGLSVQDTLRTLQREQLAHPETLKEKLTQRLEQRLAPWGVRVEQAGFPSITPSARTLRVTQFSRTLAERARVLNHLQNEPLEQALALGLLGSRTRFTRRTARMVKQATANTSLRRVRAELVQRGIRAAELGPILKRDARRFSGERRSTPRSAAEARMT